ncbi:hypothetical protein FSP39_008578 [Pinctada imbricata]|uniref:Uncharacterized protein n=1 Tax=Pinctada imbricata TaxID=66713 RepID=A0AA88YPB5_PINIB|nr:hypothetical protein FSP39_008578 [Pinctada imbricata]
MKSKRENHATLNAMMSNEEDDVQGFLGTGKSYAKYNRERMSSFFENKSTAKERVNVTNAKIKEGKKKPKNHIGNLKNYSIDKEELLHHMRSLPSGSTVVWSSLAKRFNLSVNGKIPLNGGHVIKALVKENGIDPGSFNTAQQSTVFHGYLQRIRRAKKRLGYGLTAPASRPVCQLHTAIKKKINAKEINIGDNIAPKTYKTNKINKEGNLVEVNTTVYGRKISLEKIRQDMLNEQVTSNC